MLLSNVLQTIESYINASGILAYDPTRTYDLQITPDERPYPLTGRHVVTIYGGNLRRERVDSQQRKFILEYELCISQKLTRQPYDRQYKGLYTELITSLSNTSELLLYTIDSNYTLISQIRSSINSNITNITTILDNLSSSSSEGITDEISNNLASAEVIGPMTVVDFISKPIPRDDFFFTSYDTKRNTIPPSGSDIIVDSGYSMKLRVLGPSIILPTFCL